MERALGEDADGSTDSAACHEAGAEVRIGLVSMLKKPLNVESWLRYYCDVIGVERFFLKVGASPHHRWRVAPSPVVRSTIAGGA